MGRHFSWKRIGSSARFSDGKASARPPPLIFPSTKLNPRSIRCRIPCLRSRVYHTNHRFGDISSTLALLTSSFLRPVTPHHLPITPQDSSITARGRTGCRCLRREQPQWRLSHLGASHLTARRHPAQSTPHRRSSDWELL